MARSTLFQPDAEGPFRVSRSKIDLFLKCQRCFYLDRRLGIGRPKTPPFSLNNAVDELLKREFDAYRAAGEPHPIMTQNGIDAVPFAHPDLDAWRDALHHGVRARHEPTGFEVTGGVDDVWQDAFERLIVVDYKATAKAGEVSLDAPWQIAYKRQVEIYQWLLRQNGFDVSDTAYFVYVNGDLSAPSFENRLSFTARLLPHVGSTDWVEPTLDEMLACLGSDVAPPPSEDCDYCRFAGSAAGA